MAVPNFRIWASENSSRSTILISPGCIDSVRGSNGPCSTAINLPARAKSVPMPVTSVSLTANSRHPSLVHTIGISLTANTGTQALGNDSPLKGLKREVPLLNPNTPVLLYGSRSCPSIASVISSIIHPIKIP